VSDEDESDEDVSDEDVSDEGKAAVVSDEGAMSGLCETSGCNQRVFVTKKFAKDFMMKCQRQYFGLMADNLGLKLNNDYHWAIETSCHQDDPLVGHITDYIRSEAKTVKSAIMVESNGNTSTHFYYGLHSDFQVDAELTTTNGVTRALRGAKRINHVMRDTQPTKHRDLIFLWRLMREKDLILSFEEFCESNRTNNGQHSTGCVNVFFNVDPFKELIRSESVECGNFNGQEVVTYRQLFFEFQVSRGSTYQAEKNSDTVIDAWIQSIENNPAAFVKAILKRFGFISQGKTDVRKSSYATKADQIGKLAADEVKAATCQVRVSHLESILWLTILVAHRPDTQESLAASDFKATCKYMEFSERDQSVMIYKFYNASIESPSPPSSPSPISTPASQRYTTLTKALSMDVVVDKRLGLRSNGIYQEPLQQVLEYAGVLSMSL
jgi:hypothetical protein